MAPTLRYKLVCAIVVLFGYLILLMPAKINGGPIYWPDSIAYLHGGSSALAIVTGVDTRYSEMERVSRETSAKTDAAGESPAHDSAETPVVATSGNDYRISTARSPYYSVLLAGTSHYMGTMAPVYAKAALVMVSLLLLVRAIFQTYIARPIFLTVLALSVTSAGFFTAVLLPDILAPLAVIAVAVLFMAWQELKPWEVAFWFGILCLSILSHTTHMALILLILPFCVVLTRFLLRRPALAPMALIIAAVAVGVVGQMVFSTMIERKFGYAPQSFPMIAASITVDGTGRRYLEATCPENGFVYCDYLDTNAVEVDQYLWSKDPDIGVYQLASEEVKSKLSEQQWRYLINTLRYDFTGQFRASFKRLLRQVGDNSLIQFAYGDNIRDQIALLPDPDRSIAVSSGAFEDRFNFRRLGNLTQVVAWAALALTLYYVVFALTRRRQTAADIYHLHSSLIFFSVIAVVAVVVNAGLTGAASQPQGRYSARLLWLFPIAFALWSASGLIFPKRLGCDKNMPRMILTENK